MERDVKDALAYKYTTYMPKVFQKVLKKHAEDIHKSNPNQMSKETIYEQYRRYGESFKALFKYYPCMKELTHKFDVSSSAVPASTARWPPVAITTTITSLRRSAD